MGFSVRNTGPLPMTVLSVASLGSESSSTLAELHPVLPPVAATFAIDRNRPYAPIEVAAGEEATIYFIGRIRACDVVRGHWSPGVGMRFDLARITVRWLLMSTEIEIPLRNVLLFDAPAQGQCP